MENRIGDIIWKQNLETYLDGAPAHSNIFHNTENKLLGSNSKIVPVFRSIRVWVKRGPTISWKSTQSAVQGRKYLDNNNWNHPSLAYLLAPLHQPVLSYVVSVLLFCHTVCTAVELPLTSFKCRWITEEAVHLKICTLFFLWFSNSGCTTSCSCLAQQIPSHPVKNCEVEVFRA
jgi:hypothetical protein